MLVSEVSRWMEMEVGSQPKFLELACTGGGDTGCGLTLVLDLLCVSTCIKA